MSGAQAIIRRSVVLKFLDPRINVFLAQFCKVFAYEIDIDGRFDLNGITIAYT